MSSRDQEQSNRLLYKATESTKKNTMDAFPEDHVRRFMFANNGRMPNAAAGERPWRYRGWLRVIFGQIDAALDLANIRRSRWAYINTLKLNWRLPDEPIPAWPLYETGDPVAQPTMCQIKRVVSVLGDNMIDSLMPLLQWLCYALDSLPWAPPGETLRDGIAQKDILRDPSTDRTSQYACGYPREISDALALYLYREDWTLMMLTPADYFGDIIAEMKGSWNRHAFFPTPLKVCRFMSALLSGAEYDTLCGDTDPGMRSIQEAELSYFDIALTDAVRYATKYGRIPFEEWDPNADDMLSAATPKTGSRKGTKRAAADNDSRSPDSRSPDERQQKHREFMVMLGTRLFQCRPPADPVKDMPRSTILDSNARGRETTLCEPCVGTMRMLLVAFNTTMRMVACDIDPLMVATCRLYAGLWMPWVTEPIPEQFWQQYASDGSLELFDPDSGGIPVWKGPDGVYRMTAPGADAADPESPKVPWPGDVRRLCSRVEKPAALRDASNAVREMMMSEAEEMEKQEIEKRTRMFRNILEMFEKAGRENAAQPSDPSDPG